MVFSGSAREVAAELRRRQAAVLAAVTEESQRQGLVLQGLVRARMSGRPGPRAQTGDLRRSVGVRTSDAGGFVQTRVFSNEPQAWRLEMGFIGTDSLGRDYHQPPFAAWRPALSEAEPEVGPAMRAAVVRALRGEL